MEGKIKIMVGGQVVGTTAKPIHIVTDGYTKAEAIAEAADIKRSWDISCGAMVGPRDGIKDFIGGIMSGKVDVAIQSQTGKLPRKMKKAHRSCYSRNTKWLRKVRHNILRHTTRICGAEMVLDREQQDILAAIIKGGTIEHGCVVSGKQIHEAISKYNKVRCAKLVKDVVNSAPGGRTPFE